MGKNAKMLENELKKKENLCVLFYATWCPFSLDFLPVFKEYEKTKPTECMRVIVDDEEELCHKYSIEYYPTVILFKKGKVYKRLDAEHGVGLSRTQLKELVKEP